jgi:DNA-binding protein HU-beta
MNRRELVKAVAEYTGQEPRAVEGALRGFETVVAASIGKGEPVVLSGFAKFARVDRKARMGRNPATGEPVKIKASRKARITPLKGLKDVVGGVVPVPKLTAPKPAAAAPAKKAAPKKAARPRRPRRLPPRRRTAKAAPAKKAPARKTLRRLHWPRRLPWPRRPAPAKRAAKKR